MSHPFDKTWFQVNRAALVSFCEQIHEAIVVRGKRHILIKAPVKSGKRVIMEFLSVLLADHRVKYITSLNRVDVKNQQEELESYGINTHLTKDDRSVTQVIAEIEYDIAHAFAVIAGFDECDYGSGDRQKMARLYKKFADVTAVVKLYISATAHETEASRISHRPDFEAFTYEPPPEYCGAKFFLDAGLVYEPLPFFEIEEGTGNLRLTNHAKQVLRESINVDRHIGVVRTTRKIPTRDFHMTITRKSIERQLQAVTGKPWELVVVDQTNAFDWEDSRNQNMTLNKKTNYLIVIMQTCTRGTDLKGWHHKLGFWHDQRAADAVNLNTLLQAIRVCHYSSDYPDGDFNPGGPGKPTPQAIRLYMDPRIVRMAADDDLRAYLAAGGKVPTRTTTGRPRGRPSSTEGWGVPFAITLPDSLCSELAALNATAANRPRWTAEILPLIPEDMRDSFVGRELSTKRTAPDGVRLVHRDVVAREPCRANPGGAMNDTIFDARMEYFWLDIATLDLPLDDGTTIRKGTAYVTYGVEIPSETSSPAESPHPIHAKSSSMYEH
jgi:hypothetical protein